MVEIPLKKLLLTVWLGQFQVIFPTVDTELVIVVLVTPVTFMVEAAL
jgi:hypothetical protein